MTLEHDSDKATEIDGCKSEAYCTFCYQSGKFAQDISMEEMVAHNLQDLAEWNESVGSHFTEREAREQLMEFLPTLKRWKSGE